MSAAPWEDDKEWLAQQGKVPRHEFLATQIDKIESRMTQEQRELAVLKAELQAHNEKQFLGELAALYNKHKMHVSASAGQGYIDEFFVCDAGNRIFTAENVLEYLE